MNTIQAVSTTGSVNIRTYLSKYNVLVIQQALEALREVPGCGVTFLNDKTTFMFGGDSYLPVNLECIICVNGGEYYARVSECSQDEYVFYGLKYRLSITAVENGCPDSARWIVEKVKGILSHTVPDTFMSMEHFFAYIGEAAAINITRLSDTMMLSALRAVETMFHDYTVRGEVVYENTTNGKAPKTLRLQVRGGKYLYIKINRFTVYEKDGLLFACGIREVDNLSGPMFFMTLFTANEHSHQLQEIFDGSFEQRMYEGVEIRGGKFTGDHTIISLERHFNFEDMVIDESIREQIRKEIFGFFEMEPLYRKAGIPFKRGVALFGPPGTGKTMLSKIIVSNFEQTVIWVKAGDVSTPEDIDRIFRLARMGRPSVVILEDIDFYTQDRNNGGGDRIGIATLMSHLDGLEENDGILVIITTNRIEVIEKAIVERPGRIDTRIFLGELGREKISELLEAKLGSFEREFGYFKEVVPEFIVMTGAVTVELSTLILRNAMREAGSVSDDIVITRESVTRAFKETERLQKKTRLGFRG
ncbi:MAG TPA: AAA family ATPase [Spirochaetota bacterium]|nr:AAA family ATPase [Spirochaetota bacterium]